MNRFLVKYYENYWKKRLNDAESDPIPGNIPDIISKYSAYGSILNLIPHKSNILDLGCGNGNVSRVYLKRGSVTGIDISRIALIKAQKNGIRTIHHDLNEIPYPLPSKNYDVIVLTDVIEHVINPLAVLNECSRLLKKGGKVIITVPNFARTGNRFRMLLGDPVDQLHFSKYGDEVEHLHWFTKPKITHMLRISGFSEITFHPTGLKNLNFIFGIFRIPGFGNFLTLTATNYENHQ